MPEPQMQIRDPGAENSKATSVSVGLVQCREAAGGHARSRLFRTVGVWAAVGLILRSQMIYVRLKIFRDSRHMFKLSWGTGLCSRARMGRVALEGGRGGGYNEGLISSG